MIVIFEMVINTHKGLPCGNEGFIRKLSDNTMTKKEKGQKDKQ
jgi:hypothetical protein